MGIMQFMDRAAPLALDPAIAALGNEAQGLAIDFAAMRGFIRDRVTSANNWLGGPNAKLTYASPSVKWIWNAHGILASGTTLRCDHDPASLDTSSTPLNSMGIGAGAVVNKSIVLASGAFTYSVGEMVRITDATDISKWILGRVVSWTAGTKTLVIAGYAASASYVSGSNWKVIVALGIRVESQRANLLLWSSDFTHTAGWAAVNSPVIATGGDLGPDGSAMTVVSQPSGNSSASVRIQSAPAIAVAASTVHCLSAFFRKGGSAQHRIAIYDGAVTVAVASLNVNWDANGVPTLSAGTNVIASFVDNCGGGLYRVGFTFNSDVQTTLKPLFYVGAGNATDGFKIWGAQLEVGLFPSSYIPTTTAQVTRAADNISLATSLFPWSETAMTAVMEYAPHEIVKTLTQYGLLRDTAGIFEYSPTSSTNARGHDGTTSITFGVQVDGINKVASSFGAGGLRGSLNGAAVASQPFDGVFGVGSVLNIGSYLGGGVQPMHLRRLKLIPRQATDAELQAWAS